jgi:Tfp pilus assembly protein PilF
LYKLQMGDAGAARKVLEEALQINPSDVLALRALNQSYETLKEAPMAVAKVSEYAARQPKSAGVQEFLGELLAGSGDLAGARAAFQAAKAADPQSVQADLSLVQVDLVEGKLDDAEHRLRAVLSANPADTTAHLWMGNLAASRGDYRTSEEQLRAVIAADPDNHQALNNLAYILAERNQPGEALKFAQRAKELAPDRPVYADTLGWILYQQGLYASAIRELESAVAKRADPIWQYHLAMAYAKAGDQDRARHVLQAALQQNPRIPEAKIAQQVVGVAAK